MAACNNGAGGRYPKAVIKPQPSFNALRIIKKPATTVQAVGTQKSLLSQFLRLTPCELLKKMIHIPILRAGRSYRSLNTVRVPHIKTGEPLVEVSQANRGLIAKDLVDIALQKEVLGQRSVAELISICKEAARLFTTATLPLDGTVQSPTDYIQQVSGTTGLPEALCQQNLLKIQGVLENIDTVLDGLTRGLDLQVLDTGWGVQNGRTLSYVCETDSLGAVLPSNSPGVHSLWVPAIPLKVPVVLKPGREEPWTPYRIAQAFIAAGAPAEAFSFYPTDYGGANEILVRCGRAMLFGGGSTVAPWVNTPHVEIHGPGRSKIIIHEGDQNNWEQYLDLIAESVAKNGGRSCINASGVWVTAHGREIAEALAERLARIEPKPLGSSRGWNRSMGESEICTRHLIAHRPAPQRAGCDGVDNWGPSRRIGWMHLPQTHCYLVRRCRAPVSKHRIPVSIRECCGSAADTVGRVYWRDTGCHRDYRRYSAHARSHSDTAR